MSHVKILIDGLQIPQVTKTEGQLFTEVIILLFIVHKCVMLVVETSIICIGVLNS